MKKLASILFTVLLVTTAGAQNVFAVTVTFPDFSSTAGLTLNGDAAAPVNNGIDLNPVLRLVPAIGGQSGSAFSSTTINAADFSTQFQFRITNPGGITDASGQSGADGFVFVIQPVSSSIGGSGGGLGYSGVTPSVGVEFDTFHNPFDPNTNHIGIDTNGNVNTNAQGSSIFIPQRFDDGTLQTAWIDYDGTTLEVFISSTNVKPGLPVLTKIIDIPTIIGTNNAFVGFTAGTGAAVGNHDIVNWIYFDFFNPNPDEIVGGKIIQVETAILLLAGAQTSAIWMIPTLAGLAAAGFYLNKKRN